MSIESLKNRLPDFANDIRLNLSAMANDESLPEQTKYGLFLACAIATRSPYVLNAIDRESSAHLTKGARDAARAAAAIMAMNNVYNRFVHLASNKAYAAMPVKLRMNVIGNPGVPKSDFELWSLGVSAINGCGMSIDAHENLLMGAGVPAEMIHTAVRFAAIIQSAAIALEAAELPLAAE